MICYDCVHFICYDFKCFFYWGSHFSSIVNPGLMCCKAQVCWNSIPWFPWSAIDSRQNSQDSKVSKSSPTFHPSIWARVKRRYERLQLRSAITTQNMWFTVCSDRGPYVAIPLFRLCFWLKLPVGRMTFQSFDVRVRHWSSRSGLVFLGSCKMACRQVYMR